MSVKAKLIIDDIEINVLQFNFRFKQGADEVGHPSEIPIFAGLETLIESRSDLNLADWSFAPDMAKQIELHIYPVTMDGRTRRLYFFDSHLIGWKHDFSSTGNIPLTEKLTITAAGIKDSTMEEEYSVYWRTTFPDNETQPTTAEETGKPNFIGYYLEDIDGNKITKKDISVNDEFYLYIETEFSEGESISIDLKDTSKDYEYNGKYMKNDIIKNIPITGDLTKVKLKAVEEQN